MKLQRGASWTSKREKEQSSLGIRDYITVGGTERPHKVSLCCVCMYICDTATITHVVGCVPWVSYYSWSGESSAL